MAHWTAANSKAYIHRITFDFVAQLEKRMDGLDWKQSDLARELAVTEGSVSQVLNNDRNNLTLKSMVSYANALGLKLAIVAYDDDDPQHEYGPVGSEIFEMAWDRLGKPRDVWALKENVQAIASNAANRVALEIGHPYWGTVLSTTGFSQTVWIGASGSISTTSGTSASVSTTPIGKGSTLTHA